MTQVISTNETGTQVRQERRSGDRELLDRMQKLETQVAQLKESVADMVTVFNAVSGAFKVIEWFGKVLKPLMIIGTFLAGVMMYVRGMPKIFG